MKVLPDRRHQIAEHQQSGQTLGRGMDFALVVLVFLGIGYGLDRWLDTRPVFMIGLVVFSVVGQFIKMYFDYTARDEGCTKHERVAAKQRQRRRADGQAQAKRVMTDATAMTTALAGPGARSRGHQGHGAPRPHRGAAASSRSAASSGA